MPEHQRASLELAAELHILILSIGIARSHTRREVLMVKMLAQVLSIHSCAGSLRKTQ